MKLKTANIEKRNCCLYVNSEGDSLTRNTRVGDYKSLTL